MKFTGEHEELRRTWRTIIDRDINPHVNEWEEAGVFPAHELFKKLGDAGLLGVDTVSYTHLTLPTILRV